MIENPMVALDLPLKIIAFFAAYINGASEY